MIKILYKEAAQIHEN